MNKIRQFDQTLKKVKCFSALDECSLTLLHQKMRRVTYAQGEIICEQGEPGDWLFIVESGEIRVITDSDDGVPVQVAVLEPGDFGGVQSLFEAKPRSAKLKALNEVELWRLDHDVFKHLIASNSGLAMSMLAFMSRRMTRDSHNLAVTLNYIGDTDLRQTYEECSPQERLILDIIVHKALAAESLEEVMNFLFESFQKLNALSRLGLAFLEDDGRRVVAYWARADYEPLLLTQGYAADLKGSSLQEVLRSGEPRLINDLEKYAREHPDSESTQLMLEEGIRSSMTCPLIVEDRPVGFLFRSSCRPNAYDERQVRLHMAIADRLSQTVEKAHRIEQLTKANRAYFEMLGFVTHELRSPLASITMDAEALLGGYLGKLEPAQEHKMQSMVRKAEHLLGLIREYLNLSRLESGPSKPEFRMGVDFIEDVVLTSLDIVEAQLEAKGMTLTRNWPEPLSRVECAPGLLQIAVANLLSNAIKYGNDGGAIRVSITSDREALKMAVWNEGPGFPEAERSKLFRKFSRIQTSELLKRRGTGVGLYTTWRIIQSHHGRIHARSEHGSWAEFSFEIPQPIARSD